MTYASLFRKASGIAGEVYKRLEGRSGLAAVLLPRGFLLLEAMTGILQAGSAYMLLSPELPEGRIKKILEKSGADLLLTAPEFTHGGDWQLPVMMAGECGETKRCV